MDETPQEPAPPGGTAAPPGGTAAPPTPPLPPAPPAPPTWSDPNWGFPAAQPAPSMAPPGRSGAKRALVAVLAVLLVAGAAGAVLLLQGGSKKGAAQTPTSEPTVARASDPSPTAPLSPTVLAPANVTTVAGGFAVTISWSPAVGGDQPDGYTVYRDGGFLGSVVAPETTYTDETVLPGKLYTYEVRAKVGELESEGVPAAVKTPIPSLADARVEGDFNVKISLVSEHGYSSFSDDYTLGWHFKPKCAAGPCSVVWTDLSFDQIKATLLRKKDTYSGTDSGKYNVQCNSTTVVSDLTVSFHVSKAKAIDGEWRATKLTGTFIQAEASQLGCVSSTATLNIVATLST